MKSVQRFSTMALALVVLACKIQIAHADDAMTMKKDEGMKKVVNMKGDSQIAKKRRYDDEERHNRQFKLPDYYPM